MKPLCRTSEIQEDDLEHFQTISRAGLLSSKTIREFTLQTTNDTMDFSKKNRIETIRKWPDMSPNANANSIRNIPRAVYRIISHVVMSTYCTHTITSQSGKYAKKFKKLISY